MWDLRVLARGALGEREKTVKAAVVPELGAKLEIRDVPIPEPGPGQVLVQIEASGLCHTDIHAARGDWPVKPKMPLIPGHEGIGVIIEVGDGPSPVAVGDRVALPWLGHACGHCKYCVTGWETYCQAPAYMGYTIDGSYGEYAVGYASHVVKVPAGVSSFEAAPLACAGVTTYKAVKVAHPQPAETAMVVGVGGLGHLALQYAALYGTRTIAVDVEDAKLQLAKDLGADHVVDGRGDQQAEIAALGGVDVAVVTVPSPAAMQKAHAALNPNGQAGHRRPARRQPPRDPGLRDRPQGHLGDRVAGRHPQRPDRGVRLPRAGPHPGDRGAAPARGRQRVLRGGPRRARPGPAGLRPDLTRASGMIGVMQLDDVLVLDGGLSNALEDRGLDLSSDLWTARLLLDDPHQVAAVHRDYYRAGADVVTTASYQASVPSLVAAGLTAAEAERTITFSVELARRVRDEVADYTGRRLLVAASVGPYGAVLADGSEYRGRYGVSRAALRDFHGPRLELLAAAGPDLLAVETIPDAEEAEVLVPLLDELGLPAWFSYSVDGGSTRAGQPLAEAFGVLAGSTSIVASGVNCSAPHDVLGVVTTAVEVTGPARRRLPEPRRELGQRDAHLARRRVVRHRPGERLGRRPVPASSGVAAASGPARSTGWRAR